MLRAAWRQLGGILRRAGLGACTGTSPPIATLGIIGNRRTAAVVTTQGSIVWYCPGRFDAPSLLNALLDPERGGSWQIDLPGATPLRRRYLDTSAVLETTLSHASGPLVITDWMPLADAAPGAIIRQFSAAPDSIRLVLRLQPDHGRRKPEVHLAGDRTAVIDARFTLHASHRIEAHGAALCMSVPKGEASWAVLADGAPAAAADTGRVQRWQAGTLESWAGLAARSSYDGIYAPQVHASLRALRLLTYADTGAIAAAVTTSLPEIEGGGRNYDYRYSWLRDSGIVIRALVRLERDAEHARGYLNYIASLLGTGYRSPLDVVSAVGGERVPAPAKLPVAGFHGSQPAWNGNKAATQLQLGSFANLVLAAAEIYDACDMRACWEAIVAVADFLALYWGEREHGIWEESQRRHYTTSLVLTCCALERIAKYATTETQARRYRGAAGDIRSFIARACHTRAGAFAAMAGGTEVDVSAALFPIWGFLAATSPAMDATLHALDTECSTGAGLYHRHLLDRKAMRQEGAFLAGTFWVAHCRILRGDFARGRKTIESGLRYANDLGLFAEEVATPGGALLGNFPMALVHGSFLAAVADMPPAM